MAKKHSIWDDEDLLRDTAKISESSADMLRKLGLSPSNSGNYQTLKSRSLKFNIDLPTFDRRKSNTTVATLSNTIPLELLFSDRGVKTSSELLKKKLIKYYEFKDECLECGQLPFWNNKPLVLELDHIDGNSFNNEVSNLRILCGHCHSQTDNFRGKNKSSKVYSYCSCGSRISKTSTRCIRCSKIHLKEKRKSESRYPCIEDIYKVYLEAGSLVALGKHFNVSDNAIRKHILSLGITIEDFKQGSLV